MPPVVSSAALQPARLEFSPDGTPRSSVYGDVYHSAHGGPAQARHVFLAGNDLPGRWAGRDHFTLLETGFGLGLNFLATWVAWVTDSARCAQLHFVSVEKHPFHAADLARAHADWFATWPEAAPLSAQLCAAWPALTPGEHTLELAGGALRLTLWFGDACTVLPTLDLAADALYLDGFSPARNPELWSPEICAALARCAAPGASLATWSVAGGVRRALDAAGFALERRPGFSGKREMLVGRRVDVDSEPVDVPRANVSS